MRKHKVLIIVCSILGISVLGVAGCYFNDSLRSKVTSMVSGNSSEEYANPDNRVKTLDDEIVLDYQETAEDLEKATDVTPTYTDYQNSGNVDKVVPLVYGNGAYDYYSNAVYDRFGKDCPESIIELESTYNLGVFKENGDYVCVYPYMNMDCEANNCSYVYSVKFVLSGDCDVLLEEAEYLHDDSDYRAQSEDAPSLTKGTMMEYLVGEYVKRETDYFMDMDGVRNLFGDKCDTVNIYDNIVALYPDFTNYGIKGVYISDLVVLPYDFGWNMPDVIPKN